MPTLSLIKYFILQAQFMLQVFRYVSLSYFVFIILVILIKSSCRITDQLIVYFPDSELNTSFWITEELPNEWQLLTKCWINKCWSYWVVSDQIANQYLNNWAISKWLIYLLNF